MGCGALKAPGAPDLGAHASQHPAQGCGLEPSAKAPSPRVGRRRPLLAQCPAHAWLGRTPGPQDGRTAGIWRQPPGSLLARIPGGPGFPAQWAEHITIRLTNCIRAACAHHHLLRI